MKKNVNIQRQGSIQLARRTPRRWPSSSPPPSLPGSANSSPVQFAMHPEPPGPLGASSFQPQPALSSHQMLRGKPSVRIFQNGRVAKRRSPACFTKALQTSFQFSPLCDRLLLEESHHWPATLTAAHGAEAAALRWKLQRAGNRPEHRL